MSFEHQKFELVVEDLAPGSVRLSVLAINNTLGLRYDKVRFDRYAQVTTPSTRGDPVPDFESSFFYHEESQGGSIVVTEQQPGIYFFGATPSYQGRAGQCTAGGLYTVTPSQQPTALVLAGPDGSLGNQSLPRGFKGGVHRMIPLRTKHQFCIRNPNVTLFPGCRMNIPLCRPDPKHEIPDQPRFMSIIVLASLSVFPLSNSTSKFVASVNQTSALPPSHNTRREVKPSYIRYTFQPYSADKTNGKKLPRPRWSLYNNEVSLYFVFNSTARAGEVAEVRVMIHDQLSDAQGTRGWQTLYARLVPAPRISLPNKLTTSLTWGDASMLYTGPGVGGPYSFLRSYKQMGFNTVPLVSMNMFNGAMSKKPSAIQRMVYPGNRTTDPHWQGLRFGPELSAIGPTHIQKTVRLPPNRCPVLPLPLTLTIT